MAAPSGPSLQALFRAGTQKGAKPRNSVLLGSGFSWRRTSHTVWTDGAKWESESGGEAADRGARVLFIQALQEGFSPRHLNRAPGKRSGEAVVSGEGVPRLEAAPDSQQGQRLPVHRPLPSLPMLLVQFLRVALHPVQCCLPSVVPLCSVPTFS